MKTYEKTMEIVRDALAANEVRKDTLVVIQNTQDVSAATSATYYYNAKKRLAKMTAPKVSVEQAKRDERNARRRELRTIKKAGDDAKKASSELSLAA